MKFEYRLVQMRLFERRLSVVEEDLNRLGEDGWELVQACGPHGEIFVFQRDVPASKRPRTTQRGNE